MEKFIQQELPDNQKLILEKALISLQNILKLLPENQTQYLDFDLSTLRALLNYKIIVQLTEKQFNSFTKDNKLDFPEYIK